MKRKALITTGIALITILLLATGNITVAEITALNYAYEFDPSDYSSCGPVSNTQLKLYQSGDRVRVCAQKCDSNGFGADGAARLYIDDQEYDGSKHSYNQGDARVCFYIDPLNDGYGSSLRHEYYAMVGSGSEPDLVTGEVDGWIEFSLPSSTPQSENYTYHVSTTDWQIDPNNYVDLRLLPEGNSIRVEVRHTSGAPMSLDGEAVLYVDGNVYGKTETYNSGEEIVYFYIDPAREGFPDTDHHTYMVKMGVNSEIPTPSVEAWVEYSENNAPTLTRSRLYVDDRNYLVLEFCGTNIHQDVYIGSKREGRDFGIHTMSVDLGTSEECATDNDLADGTVLPGTTYYAGVALAQQDVYNVCNSNEGLCASVTTELPSSGFQLPYPGGITRKCTNGNNGTFSHLPGSQTAYAFDFSKGNGVVVAAREGRVVYVKDDSSTYGCDKSYESYANLIIIRHPPDNTGTIYETIYLHLAKDSALVSSQVGDDKPNYVQSGQPIARIGKSGYMCGEHLHYHVRQVGKKSSVPTSFLEVTTNNGIPQAGQFYISANYFNNLRNFKSLQMTPMDSNYPPIGSVRFSLAGTAPHTLQLEAYDYESDYLQMRLASTYELLETAEWQSFAPSLPWMDTEVWVQFKDEFNGFSRIYSDTISAMAYQPLQVDFAVSSSVCKNEPVLISNLTVLSCPQCGWEWSLGNGLTGNWSQPTSPYLGYPDITYDSPGVYTITLTATNVVSESSISKSITVLDSLTADFSLNRIGNTIYATASEASAKNWAWDFGDGNTAIGKSVTHTYTENTDKNTIVQLRVTSSNDCVSISHKYPYFNVFLPFVFRE